MSEEYFGTDIDDYDEDSVAAPDFVEDIAEPDALPEEAVELAHGLVLAEMAEAMLLINSSPDEFADALVLVESIVPIPEEVLLAPATRNPDDCYALRRVAELCEQSRALGKTLLRDPASDYEAVRAREINRARLKQPKKPAVTPINAN